MNNNNNNKNNYKSSDKNSGKEWKYKLQSSHILIKNIQFPNKKLWDMERNKYWHIHSKTKTKNKKGNQ